jgi:hypothetical protein
MFNTILKWVSKEGCLGLTVIMTATRGAYSAINMAISNVQVKEEVRKFH